uniref:regulatory-associated protein of mTOR-like n=1 Tax=Styela clava TaxID=7725 RepID=UPI001939BF2B|nr:regulatory-associated protein of mTOR-like [Styela clava]
MLGRGIEKDEEKEGETVDEDAEILHNMMEAGWNLPLAFQQKRHLESITSSKPVTQTWRMKERMKTVSVALVLCLNVGVDPPDVVKTTPCARQECWIDPSNYTPQKALEAIGNNLQKQYERWQSRARYKQTLDPTVEDVKRLCTSLRRNSKEERVLFHYNGHGVPKPTVNGEIWVFNKTYTQYIPLSIYDLQTWMGTPSIFVYDCSNSGVIVNSFKMFAKQREKDMQINGIHPIGPSMSDAKNCIQLAACSESQLLPMNPELPADLFTSCLTTPIKIALQWFCLQKHGSLVPSVTLSLIEKIPGRLNDRRTPLGELNWIFTAITDTIAWNTLPRDLFQKLFRQDLLVASLFRNFLLAERIMRSYHCTPVSHPPLPPTFRHPMWAAWDHAVDICLSQLPAMLEEASNYQFQHSPFFAQHLTAFQVWLRLGVEEREPPEQLPIVLQVLLSQVHRLRALELLGSFLDLGPWAVSLALSVGIFPYVLKLLQSLAKELRPLLVFIWAKILAVDCACQADLVKDGGHHYFLRVLQDPHMSSEHRTMATFVLTEIMRDYPAGQEACLQANIVATCLDQFDDTYAGPTTWQLRQWVAICLGHVWTNYDAARWRGVRESAHEKLYELLDDPYPEVRAAAVFALGTFVDNQPEAGSDHATHIDHSVGNALIPVRQVDGSPLVRRELAAALQRFVSCYDSSFCAVACRFLEEERNLDALADHHKRSASVQMPFGPLHGKSGRKLNSSISQASLNLTSSRTRYDSLGTLPANVALLKPQMSSGDLNESLSPGNDGSYFPPANQFSINPSPSVDEGPLTTKRLDRLRQISFSGIPANSGLLYSSVYTNIWKLLLSLAIDPYPEVSELSRTIVSNILEKVQIFNRHNQKTSESQEMSSSLPSSPRLQRRSSTSFEDSESELDSKVIPIPLTPYSRTRKLFGRPPDNKPNPNSLPRQSSRVDITSIITQEKICSTEFCEWSASVFAKPSTNVTSATVVEEDPVKRHLNLTRYVNMQNDITRMRETYDTSCLSEQQFQWKNSQIPSCLCFHPHDKSLLVADKKEISIWNWEKGVREGKFRNGNSSNTKISSMEFINTSDDPLLLVGTDDGCVRVWRDCCENQNTGAELVTGWQAAIESLPSARGAGLILSWDQKNLQLYTAGDSRNIQVWDTVTEQRVQELSTGADSCVTSLSLDDQNNLLIAGCGDGTIRMFDTRDQSVNGKTKVLRAHESWVVNTVFLPDQQDFLVSSSESGDVKIWDVRSLESLQSINIHSGIRCQDAHLHLPLIVCGSPNQSMYFFSHDAEELAHVKYYDGFLGQRIGFITCMRFHPRLAHLAVGTADSFLTIYSGDCKFQSP